ncbi:GntR family transcriptional regulator [Cupriavidus sp. USMAHM13]|uniref:GntR family transcriptional regulator n=1 Tax=Cupriavidus sp. USMAHM13 TaxID=1389192 RepID=UPI0008A70D99|nr:GntR family transcriptional regulator [Cupriavidus sp. USMAHM13]AOZ03290.1 GntR family transcriptional regulator [Cupriavidus sp. USMAHM13]
MAAGSASAAGEPGGRASLAGDIRSTLAAEIENGILPPGTPLDERALAQRFNVSRTPVREAIQQLLASDLVCIVARHGVSVTRMSISEVRSMLEYVGELEALAAKLAARRGDSTLHAALEDGLRQCRQAAEQADAAGYAAANTAFHEAIYAGCRNDYLASQIRYARRRVQRYRPRDFVTQAQIMHSLQDHERIAQAIVSGDEGHAADAMTLHVPAGTTGFAEFLAMVPPHFFETETGFHRHPITPTGPTRTP